MKKALAITAATLVVLAACFAVLVQQYGVWGNADPERNVDEFNQNSTMAGCMDEIDGVWLPWLRAEMHDMCFDAIGHD